MWADVVRVIALVTASAAVGGMTIVWGVYRAIRRRPRYHSALPKHIVYYALALSSFLIGSGVLTYSRLGEPFNGLTLFLIAGAVFTCLGHYHVASYLERKE